MENPGPSLVAYVSQLSRHLDKVLPRAARNSGEAAVHQSRVTTRRLNAAVDLVQIWLRKGDHKKIQESLRELRRRLGPLRDLDVMLAGLESYRSEHATAVGWLEEELRERRTKAQNKLWGLSSPMSENWEAGQLSQKLQQSSARVQMVLRKAIARDFGAFATLANSLCAAHPDRRQREIDVHALRIAGKRVRYTLEIAAAVGAALPKETGQQFKQIQDALGAWHDRVVLAQRAMKLAAKRELAMQNPQLLVHIFNLINAATAGAADGIETFVGLWTNMREELSAAVRQLWSKTLRTGTQ
jgi:CHAD domain-containing protein